jgi:hypothetical protein
VALGDTTEGSLWALDPLVTVPEVPAYERDTQRIFEPGRLRAGRLRVVRLCFAIIYLVPIVCFRLGDAVIKELERKPKPDSELPEVS